MLLRAFLGDDELELLHLAPERCHVGMVFRVDRHLPGELAAKLQRDGRGHGVCGIIFHGGDAFINDHLFTASPSLAGNRLYLFGEVEEEETKDEWVMKGKTWIVEPGREGCKVGATAGLGEGCVTSPAFQEGRIYIRGSKHLFCIGGNGTEMKSQP